MKKLKPWETVHPIYRCRACWQIIESVSELVIHTCRRKQMIYKTELLPLDFVGIGLDAHFNEMAKQGWELTSTFTVRDKLHCTWKRYGDLPRPEEPEEPVGTDTDRDLFN